MVWDRDSRPRFRFSIDDNSFFTRDIALYVVKLFAPVPPRIEQAVWAITLILCLIGALTLLAGGGGSMHFPRIG